ncbi:MAG: ParB N-terminal domain-containing protein [Kovacikia sp.]
MAPTKPSRKFKAELWDTEKVVATMAEYNPRVISEKELKALSELIKKFGFLLPVVINTRTNRMVGGHQRVRAAESLELKQVPVKLVDLDESAEKRLNLALNKIEGKWDYALLEEALAEVSEANILSLSGFSEADLIEIMAGQDEEFKETFEEFTQRFAGRKTQDFVLFRSAQVSFTCTKSNYEALVQRLYAKVGVDDVAASIEFFRLLGLEA